MPISSCLQDTVLTIIVAFGKNFTTFIAVKNVDMCIDWFQLPMKYAYFRPIPFSNPPNEIAT